MWGIYKITFSNQKSYIGQSSNLKRRMREYKNWKKHCKNQTALYAAFEKYGYENAKFTMIYESSDKLNQNILDELEIKYIKEYNTLTPNGYNIKTGGKGISGYGSYSSKVFDENYSQYINEPVINIETNEEYKTVPEWIKQNHLSYDAIYDLYKKDSKFCFKNQDQLKWDLGDGTVPINASIGDVRSGKATSYVKIPLFNQDIIGELNDDSEFINELKCLIEEKNKLLAEYKKLVEKLLQKCCDQEPKQVEAKF